MKVTLVFTLLACFARSGESAFGIPDFVEWGSCPGILPMLGLDLRKWGGTWFTQMAIPNKFVSAKSCIATNFTWKGDSFEVTTTGLNENAEKVVQKSMIIESKMSSANRPILLTQMSGAPEAPFVIFETDYENYSCIQSCIDFLGFRAQFFWIHTRKPNPSSEYVERCLRKIGAVDHIPDDFKQIYQGEICPYWNSKEYGFLKEIGPMDDEHLLTHYMEPLMHVPGSGDYSSSNQLKSHWIIFTTFLVTYLLLC